MHGATGHTFAIKSSAVDIRAAPEWRREPAPEAFADLGRQPGSISGQAITEETAALLCVGRTEAHRNEKDLLKWKVYQNRESTEIESLLERKSQQTLLNRANRVQAGLCGRKNAAL